MSGELYDDIEVEQDMGEAGKKAGDGGHRLTIKRQDGVKTTLPVTPGLANKARKIAEGKGPKVLTEADPLLSTHRYKNRRGL